MSLASHAKLFLRYFGSEPFSRDVTFVFSLFLPPTPSSPTFVSCLFQSHWTTGTFQYKSFMVRTIYDPLLLKIVSLPFFDPKKKKQLAQKGIGMKENQYVTSISPILSWLPGILSTYYGDISFPLHIHSLFWCHILMPPFRSIWWNFVLQFFHFYHSFHSYISCIQNFRAGNM